MLTELPRDIVREIQSFISIRDVYHMSMVNSTLNNISSTILDVKREEYHNKLQKATDRYNRLNASMRMKGTESLTVKYGDMINVIEKEQKTLEELDQLDSIMYYIHINNYPLDKEVGCFISSNINVSTLTFYDASHIIQKVICSNLGYLKRLLINYFMLLN